MIYVAVHEKKIGLCFDFVKKKLISLSFFALLFQVYETFLLFSIFTKRSNQHYCASQIFLKHTALHMLHICCTKMKKKIIFFCSFLKHIF